MIGIREKLYWGERSNFSYIVYLCIIGRVSEKYIFLCAHWIYWFFCAEEGEVGGRVKCAANNPRLLTNNIYCFCLACVSATARRRQRASGISKIKMKKKNKNFREPEDWWLCEQTFFFIYRKKRTLLYVSIKFINYANAPVEFFIWQQYLRGIFFLLYARIKCKYRVIFF